jgi:zinc/manganese transport system substrate-binding protein
MKSQRFRNIFAVLIVFVGSGLAAAKPLKVITTTADLASLVQEVGGEFVQVESLSKGFQNPHFVEAKPSLVVKLMDADLFIQTGLDLEVGWAPLLIQSARNPRIQPGSKGFLEASSAIATPMEVPQNPSRAMGDVHPGGNPHFLTDPENGKLVAGLIANKLSELDSVHAADYAKNLATFNAEIDRNLQKWGEEMRPFKGQKYVSYHRSWIYFAERFGLVLAGEIEPKPGIPPTAQHTAESAG